MATTPVSVLMPAFNAERYLAETIESVLAQTHREFELLIINDGSQDGTAEIIDRYAQKDARVIGLAQSNAGISTALNRGIAAARYPWLVRMDADDLMVPERIERQLVFVMKRSVVVASSFVRYIDGEGREIGSYTSGLTDERTFRERVKANHGVGFHHPAVIMRKDVVEEMGGYRREFEPAEDYDLWNRIADRGHLMLVQPEYLLRYRIHAGSVSVGRIRLASERVRWIEQCILRRRSGGSEPSWEEFQAGQRQRPLWQRWSDERHYASRAFYKAAVMAFARRRWLPLGFWLGAAFLLEPCAVWGEIAMRRARPRTSPEPQP